MRRLSNFAFACALFVASGTALAADPDRAAVVVLPFDNVSGVAAAPEIVQKLVENSIAGRGWTIVPSTTVEPLLEQQRVRYLDTLPVAARTNILEATGAAAVVSGSIYSFAGGSNAVVALSARMVRSDGSIAWTDVAAISSNDTEGAFGRGRKNETADVARAAVAALMRRMPEPGEEAALPRGRLAGLFGNAATSFRSGELDSATPHRVCVLPFENLSRDPEASRVVAEVLALRLAAADGFEVVDPATLREAALETRVGSFRGISNDALLRLGRAVGTSLFLRGTVYEFRDSRGGQGDTSLLQLEFTLVDVEDGRVLWAAQNDREGADYTGFLLRGEVTNAVALADRTITEMIEAGGKGAPRAARAFAAARNDRRKAAGGLRTELQAAPQQQDGRKGKQKP